MAKHGKHSAPFYDQNELWRIVDINFHYEIHRHQVVKETALYMDLVTLSMERKGEVAQIEKPRVQRINKDYAKGFYPTREEALTAFQQNCEDRIKSLEQSLLIAEGNFRWATAMLKKGKDEKEQRDHWLETGEGNCS